jgi:hypothetical protein
MSGHALADPAEAVVPHSLAATQDRVAQFCTGTGTTFGGGITVQTQSAMTCVIEQGVGLGAYRMQINYAFENLGAKRTRIYWNVHVRYVPSAKPENDRRAEELASNLTSSIIYGDFKSWK